MKTLTYLLNISALLCFSFGSAQSLNGKTTGPAPVGLAWGQTDQGAIDFFTNLTSRPKKVLTAADIKGTPYFNEEFKLAKVFYGGRFEDGKEIYIRHNAYSDELEMATSPYQYASEQILLKTKEVFCELDGKVFKLLPYISKSSGAPEIGYLQTVYDGEHYKVFLNQTKVFMKQQPARTSLERSFPARFVDNQTYYYSKDGETPKYLNVSKGTLKKLFKDKNLAKTTLKVKGSLEDNLEYIFEEIEKQ
ncbi:MAG: hypothetical protein KIH80_003870 [Flavobacteriia bacterium]|nr:hypothetical protein [Flavobacteriia bacterium]